MKFVRIGELRHRVTLEEAQRAGDGGGGASVSWLALTDLWARIRPVSGSEVVIAEQIAGRITHEIVLRYRAGLRPAMRFTQADRTFHIAAVLDIDERRRLLRCLCREELL